jgi:hypothetical protein
MAEKMRLSILDPASHCETERPEVSLRGARTSSKNNKTTITSTAARYWTRRLRWRTFACAEGECSLNQYCATLIVSREVMAENNVMTPKAAEKIMATVTLRGIHGRESAVVTMTVAIQSGLGLVKLAWEGIFKINSSRYLNSFLYLFSPPMSGGFEDLGLLPELVRATQDQHWILPSDVQDESIPLILGGGDVMVVRLGAAFSHCCRSLASPLHLTPPSSLLPSYCRLLRLAAARRVPLPCQPFS